MTTSVLFNDPEYKQLARLIEEDCCDPFFLTLDQTAMFAKRFEMFTMSAKCYVIKANASGNKEDEGYYMFKAGELLFMSPNNNGIHDLALGYIKFAALECDHVFAMYYLGAYYEDNKDYEKAELYYRLYCTHTKDTPEFPQVALRYALMLFFTLNRIEDAMKMLHAIMYYYEHDIHITIIDNEFNNTTHMTDVFNFYGSILLHTYDDVVQGLEYLKTGYHTYNNEQCREMLYLYYTIDNPDRKQASIYRGYVPDESDENNAKRKCI